MLKLIRRWFRRRPARNVIPPPSAACERGHYRARPGAL